MSLGGSLDFSRVADLAGKGFGGQLFQAQMERERLCEAAASEENCSIGANAAHCIS